MHAVRFIHLTRCYSKKRRTFLQFVMMMVGQERGASKTALHSASYAYTFPSVIALEYLKDLHEYQGKNRHVQ